MLRGRGDVREWQGRYLAITPVNFMRVDCFVLSFVICIMYCGGVIVCVLC